MGVRERLAQAGFLKKIMPEFPLEGRVEEKQEGQGRGHCRHAAGSENGRTVFNRTGADRPEHSVARQGDWILS